MRLATPHTGLLKVSAPSHGEVSMLAKAFDHRPPHQANRSTRHGTQEHGLVLDLAGLAWGNVPLTLQRSDSGLEGSSCPARRIS